MGRTENGEAYSLGLLCLLKKNQQRFRQGFLGLGVISKSLNAPYKLYYIIRGDEALTPPSFGGQFRLTVNGIIFNLSPKTHSLIISPSPNPASSWNKEETSLIHHPKERTRRRRKEGEKASLEKLLTPITPMLSKKKKSTF